jgi:hypothetical protein
LADYGSNQTAVRFFREVVPDTPDKKSAEMPPVSPQYGSLHPGGKEVPLPGRRYPKSMRNLPWRSMLKSKRTGVRKRKKGKLQALMS